MKKKIVLMTMMTAAAAGGMLAGCNGGATPAAQTPEDTMALQAASAIQQAAVLAPSAGLRAAALRVFVPLQPRFVDPERPGELRELLRPGLVPARGPEGDRLRGAADRLRQGLLPDLLLAKEARQAAAERHVPVVRQKR